MGNQRGSGSGHRCTELTMVFTGKNLLLVQQGLELA